jgi:hypothetical protein
MIPPIGKASQMEHILDVTASILAYLYIAKLLRRAFGRERANLNLNRTKKSV